MIVVHPETTLETTDHDTVRTETFARAPLLVRLTTAQNKTAPAHPEAATAAMIADETAPHLEMRLTTVVHHRHDPTIEIATSNEMAHHKDLEVDRISSANPRTPNPL